MGSVLSFSNELYLYAGLTAAWAAVLWAAFRALYGARSFFPRFQADRFIFVLSVAAALAQCFCCSLDAGELTISDSVEYAVGAERIYTLGTFDLGIEGRSLPPRYQPFFSLLFGVPAHALFQVGLGSPIYLVIAFGILGFVAAWLTAYRAGGVWGAVTVSVLLLVLPDFRSLMQVVMSDGPIVSAALLLLLLFVSIRKDAPQALAFLAAGILVALSISLRSVSVFLAAPFLFVLFGAGFFEALKRLFALTMPIAGMIGGILLCNYLVFSDALRTGYHFWLSVPTDFPDLLLSEHYILKNLKSFAENGGAILLLVVVVLSPVLGKVIERRTGHPPLSTPEQVRAVFFSLVIGAGSFAVFLPYFWTDFRFFAPFVAVLAVPAAGILGQVWSAFGLRRELGYLVLLALLAHGFYRELTPRPHRRQDAALRLALATPKDAVIISGLDPVFLEPLVLRGTLRTTVPFSRTVEFASKICRTAPPGPEVHPASAIDHRAAGLLGPGGFDPVAHTAFEEPEYVRTLMIMGRPVIFDASVVSDGAAKDFLARFGFDTIGDRLYRLKPS